MRYLPHTDVERRDMLAAIGAKSLDDLFADIPQSVKDAALFDLPEHLSEMEVERELAVLASENLNCGNAPCFLGAGAYRHHVPAALDYIIQRGEFLTSYTPYQPEISQGTLQAVYEFQTQVALMTGMEVANASMYDGATACAEAAAMACRVTKRDKVLMSGSVHPQYREVTRAALKFAGVQVECLVPDPTVVDDLTALVSNDLACVVMQTPGFFGHLQDISLLADTCHAQGVLLVVCITEPVSLGMVKLPGDMGADIVVCEGQSIAGPLCFGGPGVGLFATREKFVRQMPGRLAGQTTDQDGCRGWVLTLSTREQHIRREKATSNICTNSGLIALAFSIHMTLLGEAGFRSLAELNHAKAVSVAEQLEAIDGVRIEIPAFFNEFAVNLPKPATQIAEVLAQEGILGGVPASRFYPTQPQLENVLLVTVTETNTDSDLETFFLAMKEALA